MDSDVKQSEIDVYDRADDDRPTYDAYWDADHHSTLLDVGAGGHFRTLLDDYADTGRVLVLGCGTGNRVESLLRSNPDRDVVGIELSETRVEEAAENVPRGEFQRADAERLPFADDAFEAVVAHSILHHLPAWDTDGLAEINRVTESGGSLIFYEPGKYNPPAAIRRRFFPSELHTPDEHPFDPVAFENVLERHFDAVEMQGHCFASNVLPVVFDRLPFSVPTDVTRYAYRADQQLLRGPMERLSWLLTGVATTR